MMKSRSASPPRTGTIAFTPAPATDAPKTLRQRTRASGYAAARTFRHARDRAQIFANWQRSAKRTGVQAIACRWSKNAVKALKTSLIASSLAQEGDVAAAGYPPARR